MRASAYIALGVLVLGLVAVGAVAAQPATSAEAKATVVNVLLYDKGIKVSKRTAPTGTVVFRVVNKGKLKHGFRAGSRAIKLLRPGQRAKLVAQFPKAGVVSLKCTFRGHARKGMIGKLKIADPAPQRTVVDVSMFEMGFTLSKPAVVRGTVEFRVVNDGKLPHDFRITGKGTPVLPAGGRATVTVEFPQPGAYTFVCTVQGHAEAGMVGKLIVK